MKVPKYTDGDLQEALRAVKNGASVNGAAKLYNIPETTLRKKVKTGEDKINFNRFSGHFKQEEEELIFDYLISCADFGYGRTSEEIRKEIDRFLVKGPGPRKKPTKNWFHRFLKRFKKLRKISCKQMKMVVDDPTEAGIRCFHNRVTENLRKLGLLDHLYHNDRIACASVTTFQLNPDVNENLPNDTKLYPQREVKALITTLANGKFLPPFVMLPYERIPGDIKESLQFLESIRYGRCPDNKLTAEAFLDYIVKSVGDYIEKNKVERPFFLFIEGQLEFMSSQTWEYCRDAEIILLRMYPNSTWEMNPLVYGVFEHMKQLWSTFLSETKVNFGTNVSLLNFGSSLNEFIDTRSYALTKHIEESFARTGIFPWMEESIDFNGLVSCYRPKDTKWPKVGLTVYVRAEWKEEDNTPTIPTQFSKTSEYVDVTPADSFMGKSDQASSDDENDSSEHSDHSHEQPLDDFHKLLLPKIEIGAEPSSEMTENSQNAEAKSELNLLLRVPPIFDQTSQMNEFPSCSDNASLMKTINENIKRELDNLVAVATSVNEDLQEDRLKTYAIQTLFKHCPDDLKIDLLNGSFDPDKGYGVHLGSVLQAFVQDIKPHYIAKSNNNKRRRTEY